MEESAILYQIEKAAKSSDDDLTGHVFSLEDRFIYLFIYLFILYFMLTFTIKSIKHSDLYNSLYTNSYTNGIQ